MCNLSDWLLRSLSRFYLPLGIIKINHVTIFAPGDLFLQFLPLTMHISSFYKRNTW